MAGTGKLIVAWRSSPALWQVRQCCANGPTRSLKMGLSVVTRMTLGVPWELHCLFIAGSFDWCKH